MLNSKGERELAYLVLIDDIYPIEGAERVELATVGGWKIMVQKGQFSPGDLAIYFEIDSKVPEKEPFLFLEAKHYKIKTQKYFKGTVISQGLLMSPRDFGWYFDECTAVDNKSINHSLYDDSRFLTKTLNVTYGDPEDNVRKAASVDKYKAMASKHPKVFRNPVIKWIYKHKLGKKLLFLFFGKKSYKKAEWPSWVSKTDEERVQSLPTEIYKKYREEEWVATEKIDGTSTTFTARRLGKNKYEFFTCSRNVVLGNNKKSYYDETVGNVYEEMGKKYDVYNFLKTMLDVYPTASFVTLQGETFGEGVQKRTYGLDGRDFVGFNLIIDGLGRLPSAEARSFANDFSIKWVPIIDEHYVLPETVDELLTQAEGKSEIDGEMREGIVFRDRDGEKSFKAVSNAYLLKYHS